MKKLLILLIIYGTCLFALRAQQCSENTNVNGNAGTGFSNGTIGQSFTACKSGRLASVSVQAGNASSGFNNVVAQIFAGDGFGGTLLATTGQVHVKANRTTTWGLTGSNIEVVEGQKYTARFITQSGTPMMAYGTYTNSAVDYYSRGRIHGAAQAHNDMFFSAKIDIINTTLTPLDQAIEVSRLSNIQVQFTRSMSILTGDIELVDVVASTSEFFPVENLIIDGGLVTIPNATTLKANTQYEILIPAGALESTDGLAFDGFGTGDWTFTTTPDRVTSISSTAGEFTNTSPIPFAIDFSEAVTGFDVSDLTITNGSATNFAGSGISYTVDITPVAEGIIKVETLADVTVEGNEVAGDSLEYDTTNPTVLLTSNESGTISRTPFELTVQFSEPVTGFDSEFLDFVNAEIASTQNLNDSTFIVSINAQNEGIMTVDVPATSASDLAGNASVASAQFSLIYQSDLNDGLISFYPLNSSKFDVNRINEDLTDQLGTPALISDHHGQLDGGYNFSTAILYQSLFNNAPIENGFSISTWIKPTSEMGPISAKRVVYDHATSSTLYYEANALRLDLNGTTDQYIHPVVLPAETWVHIVVSVTESGNVYLYLDNIQHDLGVAPAALTEVTSALALGSASDGSFKLNGDMDEIRYYGRALHPVEAAELYNQPEYLLLSETLEICENESFTTPEGDVLNIDGNYFYVEPSTDSSPDTFVTLTLNTIAAPEVVATADNLIVCEGNEVTLIGQGADSYVWDNGVVDGISFIPTVTTTYTVTGTAANGCENTSQVTIQVAPRNFDDEALSTTAPEFCPDGSAFSATISTASSSVGVNYFLRNSIDDAVLDGPIAGTGSALDFNAGTLTASSTFNVLAEQPSAATNTALDFDGSNDKVATTFVSSASTEMTIEAWLYPRSTNYDRVITNYSGTGTVAGDVIIDTYNASANNGKALRLYLGTGSGAQVNYSVPNVLTLNTWNHIAITFNNGEVTIYVDGEQVGTTTLAITSLQPTTAPFHIGEDRGGTSTEYFNGRMDEIRIWNIVRTASEVRNNRNILLDGTETGLMAYFKLDDNTGTTAAEEVSGANGTLSNMDAATDWVAGADISSLDYFSCSFEMTQEITIGDQTAPTVTLQDITRQLGENGTVNLTASDFDNGSVDNCSDIANLTFSLDQSSFGCADIGVQAVNVTVTDEAGNEASAAVNVTIESFILDETITIADASLCPGDIGGTTVSLASSQTGVSYFLRNSNDDSVIEGPVVGTGSALDINTGILTESTTFNVLAELAPAPIALEFAGNNQFVDMAEDTDFLYQDGYSVEATVKLNAPGTAGSRPIVSYGSATSSDIEIYVQGTTNKLLVLHGRTSTSALTYFIYPSPTFGDWTHIAVTYNGASNEVNVYYDGVLQTRESEVNPTGLITKRAGAALAIGRARIFGGTNNSFVGMIDEVRIWDHQRAQGEIVDNMSSCLEGNESGLVAYYNLNEGTGLAAIDLAGGNNGTLIGMDGDTDWVEGSSISCDGGTCQFEMTTEVSITVEDNTLPTAISQDITIQLDVDGNASIVATDLDNGSSDNCNSTITLSIDKTDFTCADLGANTVTLTVTDGASNEATAVAIVTVEETTLPTVLTQNITIQLDANGVVSISAADLDNGSTDNCSAQGDLVFSADQIDFSCSDVGVNTITLTVADVSGNEAFATAIVTVEDVTGPTVITQDIVVQQEADGTVNVTAAEVNNGSVDACSTNLTFTLSKTTFDCNDLGINVVALTVTDESGNQSSADATITIEDTIVPTVVSQNVTARLDVSGNVIVDASSLNSASFDNCSSTLTFDLSQTDFNCSHLGVNTVSLSVTDERGNTATEDVIITVEENGPIVVTQDVTVELDVNGTATISTTDIDNGSSDDCTAVGDLVMSLDVVDFSCEDIDLPNQVTLTVSDLNGNVSTGTAIVTVVDLMAPSVVTQDISLVLDGNGDASITTADIDNGTSDNCSDSKSLTFSLDISTFDINDLGTNTVTLSVTDLNGNTGTETAVVTVSDKEAQVITFEGVADKIFGDANFDITATVDSGLPVTYTVVSGNVSVASATSTVANISVDGAGTALINVTNEGDATYAPLQETITINVAKADQTLIVDAITTKSVAASPITINASVDTGLTLDYMVTGPATNSGNVITLDGTIGTVTVSVSQIGSDNYNMASESISFEVVPQQSQTIDFTAIGDLTYGAVDQTLMATSSSSLAVSYIFVSGPATLSGSILTITGAGTVVVEANQIGNEDFLAASVQQTINVGLASLSVTADNQTITYGEAIPALTFSYAGFVNAESATDLTAEPTISTAADASSDAGIYAISLTGGESANYSINLVDALLTINKADQVISIDPIADKEPTDVAFDVTATVDSGLDLTYEVSGPGTISGTSITLDGSEGTMTVTVSQVGNVNYNVISESISLEVAVVLALEDGLSTGISIYPNPVSNVIKIASEHNLEGKVRMYNIRGVEMFSYDLQPIEENKIDITTLPRGLYILIIQDENAAMIRRQTILVSE